MFIRAYHWTNSETVECSPYPETVFPWNYQGSIPSRGPPSLLSSWYWG